MICSRRIKIGLARCCAAAVVAAAIGELAAAHPGPHHDIERLTRLLEGGPPRAEWHVERGMLYRLEGENTRALADLNAALRFQPGVLTAMLERGLTLMALRRDAEADAQLTQYLEGGGRSAAAYAARAELRGRGGEPDAAIADYRSALSCSPDPELYLQLGRLCESRGRPQEAAAAYREGLSRLGSPVVLRNELIQIDIRVRNFDEAHQLIDAALAQTPFKAELLLFRAEALAAAGRPDDARAARADAVREAQRAVARRGTLMHRQILARALAAAGDGAAVARAAPPRHDTGTTQQGPQP